MTLEEIVKAAERYADDRFNDERKKIWGQCGFIDGAKWALEHQWTEVREALPDFEESVLVTTGGSTFFFCHRSRVSQVKTDEDGWCNYSGFKITAWMTVPKYKEE